MAGIARLPATKPHRVDPPDYEKELASRKDDLKKEEFPNLLTFPLQDVIVKHEGWKYRTEMFPVSDQDFDVPLQLFTNDCLKFYSSQWERVIYNYSKYSGSYATLLDEEERETLSHLIFERDQIEAEKMHQEEVDLSQKVISKSGYLLKGLFPEDSGFAMSMKNYRKRWFELKGGPAYGGYTLEYYRDDKSTNVKGKVNLETCTEIKPNPKQRTYGFELLTEDDKVFYPLAAENQREMEEWITFLRKAIGLDSEDEPDIPSKHVNATFYNQDTLRDTSKRNLLRPDLLQWSSYINEVNAQNRVADRNELFILYPELLHQRLPVDTGVGPAPKEELGVQVKVTCQNLSLKLTLNRHGRQELLEPFYVTFALFDAQKGLKISEDFHVDLHNPDMRDEDGDLARLAKDTNQAIFSVTFPHSEVYLVARVEKVLQGAISSCVEPYIKTGDSLKIADRLSKQVTSLRERLGDYRMPFAWTARPLFDMNEEILQLTELGPLYRQERERLTDQELLKMLADFKNISKLRLQTIPGNLSVSVKPYTEPTGLVFTPSLLPLKVTTESATPEISCEVQEFPPLAAYESHTHYNPHISLTHNLYIYPLELKYDTQKQFTKARNIAVCIQLRDNDTKDAVPLKVIYNYQLGDVFVDTASAAVLYHCTTPTFYEEIKINLPIRISRRHHLVFIFKHISCEVSKATKSSRASVKQNTVENIIGYTWLPLLDTDGRITAGEKPLPVATTLPPGYLSILRPDLKKLEMLIPETKWVDGAKLLFTVNIVLKSTIYSQDPELFGMFAVCEHVDSGKPVPVDDLKYAIESLQYLELDVIQFLPVLLNRLMKLVCQSYECLEEAKVEIIKLLVVLVDKVTSFGRLDVLKAYIEYMFSTTVDPITGSTVHDELVKLLVEYLAKNGYDEENKILNHMWFFLDIILKSMAQYLTHTGKETATRKARYPQAFGHNLMALFSHLAKRTCDNSAVGLTGDLSLAKFIKHSFSLIDRGVVFKIISKCLQCFDIHDGEYIGELRLDFLSKICEYEHFIPLNLPFKTYAVVTLYHLNDEYCRRHYLTGLLLRELEVALQSGTPKIRAKAIGVVRNLIAKLDCDDRFSVPAQKARIATLFFPLIPLVLENAHKLNKNKNQMTEPAIVPKPINHHTLDVISEVGTPPPASPLPPLSSVVCEDGVLTFSKKSIVSELSTNSLTSFQEKHEGGRSSLAKRPSLPVGTAPPKPMEAVNPLDSLDISPNVSSAATPPLTPGPFVLEEKEEEEKTEDEEIKVVMKEDFSYKETRDLLMCFLFVLKHADNDVLINWWQQCMDIPVPPSRAFSFSGRLEETTTGSSNESQELIAFFNVLKDCLDVFEYSGRFAITKKWSARSSLLRQLEQMYTKPRTGGGKKTSASRVSMVPNRSRLSQISNASSLLSSDLLPPSGQGEEDMELYIKIEGALANEVGLTVLETLEVFGEHFKDVLVEEEDDVQLTKKFFSTVVKLLDVNPSTNLQSHIFATLRGFTHKFTSVLFKGSSEYCGALCYQILCYCNSNISQTRAEAAALLYMMMRKNFDYCNQQGFTRTGLQTTIALSKVATSSIPWSLANLRRSLGVIVTYADNDEGVKCTSFPIEVRELMIKLRTVLSSTAQMKEHRNDPEKLLDLYYSLAKSYAHSPELRHTWLESMAEKHILYGNYNEAAQCYLHIAGLIAEYLKSTDKFPKGCTILTPISFNVESDEGEMKMDKGTSLEKRYSEKDLVVSLELALSQLEKSERYELMTPVFKLLLPYYEEAKDFKKFMETYGRLYEAHKTIVSVMQTGKRYLGSYFKVAFYGELFGEDNSKEYIYREPNVTSLPELTQRLVKLYSKKFGPDVVQMIQDSGKVNVVSLDPDKAYIQVTYVIPYFTEEELTNRSTQFERENRIRQFVFETPFIPTGRTKGDVASQWIRKTVLTTSHWFPYMVKRIPIIDTQQFEISPIEVAVEAMEKKRNDLAKELEKEKKDLVKLQLLLQGSISAQVNQGVQEYANVFLRESFERYPRKFTERLKELYKSFIELCNMALYVHGQLISKDQLLLQQDLLSKLHTMTEQLMPLLDPSASAKRLTSTKSDLNIIQRSATSSHVNKQKPDLTRALTASVVPNPTTI